MPCACSQLHLTKLSLHFVFQGKDLPLDAQKEGMTVRLLQHVPCVCVLLLCHSIQVDNVQVMFARLFIDFHNTFEDGIF